jgi:hypothetical protein
MTTAADRLSRALARTGRCSLVIAPVVVLVLSTIAGTVDGHFRVVGFRVATSTLLVAVAALVAFVALAVDSRREGRRRDLEASHAELARRVDTAEGTVLDLLRLELRALEDSAGYMSNERISIFRREGDALVLLARRSKRPSFDESLGRGRIPLHEGCAGKAWAEGWAYEPCLPDPGPETGPPARRWVARMQKEWNVPAEVAEVLTMRSQMYAAFRLETATEPVGVVVFESTVSVAEHAEIGIAAPPMPGPEELRALVKDSGQRLCKLVMASYTMSADRVADLLTSQQGPGRLQAHAQGVAADAARRNSS